MQKGNTITHQNMHESNTHQVIHKYGFLLEVLSSAKQ